MLAFCSSPRFADHPTGPHHPERPERIFAVLDAVERSGLLDCHDVVKLEPVPADEKWLLTVHTPETVRRVRHVCEVGGGVLDQGDTPVGRASCDVALLAVGAVLRC